MNLLFWLFSSTKILKPCFPFQCTTTAFTTVATTVRTMAPTTGSRCPQMRYTLPEHHPGRVHAPRSRRQLLRLQAVAEEPRTRQMRTRRPEDAACRREETRCRLLRRSQRVWWFPRHRTRTISCSSKWTAEWWWLSSNRCKSNSNNCRRAIMWPWNCWDERTARPGLAPRRCPTTSSTLTRTRWFCSSWTTRWTTSTRWRTRWTRWQICRLRRPFPSKCRPISTDKWVSTL